MFQEERRTWLTSHARSNGRVDVNESAEALGVTVETIRRDLNDLENKNLLRRVHGGAIPIEGYVYESSLATRKNQFIEERMYLFWFEQG
jgi:DeoR family fructose operon transcriptional repressor